MTREEIIAEYNKKRYAEAKVKILCKVRNTETNKVTHVLSNYDYEERKRHFFNPENPDEEYPEGLYMLEPIYPYEELGIECGKGWKRIVQPIIDYIEKYNEGKKDDDKIEIHQIKEKFATLRVYLNRHDNPELQQLIENAEQEAAKTCETCGTKDNVGLTMQGWATVICDDCIKKHMLGNARQTVKWKRNCDNKVFIVDNKGNMTEPTD